MPLTERRIDVAGVSTVVLDGGDGPPVVLLHGGIECGGVFWGAVVRGLVRTHRVIVPDVPGLGESTPVTHLRAEVFAEWFAALLSRTGVAAPTLVAHSLLGSMAARFGARHGDLLGRLMIYGAPAVGPYRMPWMFRATAVRFALRPSERNLERFARWAFHDLDQVRRRDPVWWEAFDVYHRDRAGVAHVKRTMRQLITSETRPIPDGELRRIAVPTALLWGRHDRMVPLDLARHAGERFGWSLHVVEDAGHAAHIERPDAFLRALHVAITEESTA
jgi:2-hydroxymuconate-semialdehyde hydrolase